MMMMKLSRLKILLGVVIVVAAALGGWAVFHVQNSNSPNQENEVSTPSGEQEGYTIEEVPINLIEEYAPNLDRAITFDNSLPEEARIILNTKINEVVNQLKVDRTVGADWLELAVLYHSAGDYGGAREVWEFLVKVAPNNTVLYDNLGKLYHYTLKDFPKAESYFMQSISLDAVSITPYLELHSLYRYSYQQNTTRAADILRTAMKVFPNELALYLRLGAYYRDIGNVASARAVLLEGLEKARDANDVELIGTFGDEIARLPQ